MDRSELRPVVAPVAAPEPRRLGAGRSGVVWADRDATGRAVARKVFGSSGLTKLVQVVLLGTPNPYAWNEHAVETAVLRRQVLEPLVRHWFGERLRVASAWSRAWSADHLAYELHTELVEGRPPRLRHPLVDPRETHETEELVREVMRPLQARLAEAGFVGLVWQAGRGNPVALGNFLREEGPEARTRWAWIDLESGVPALFPLDPRALLATYLPASLRLRRPLFDDVDVPRLLRWIEAHRAELEPSLGAAELARLEERAERLAFHQERWKALSRTRAGVARRLARGDIDAAQAAWYAERPLRWALVEARRGARAGWRAAGRLARRARAWARALPVRRLLAGAGRFLVSQRWRRRLAQRLVARRVDAWARRGQLAATDAARLRGLLARRESCAYVTDFGVHLALKPAVKAVEYGVLPSLFVVGAFGAVTLGVLMVAMGPLARTAYTLGRLLQAAGRGEERPWTALVVGVLPVVGNLAYPLQLVASSRGHDDSLARFVLVDAGTTLGRRVPIWGGADTLTEHVANRIADRVARGRRRPAP